jgi:septal ring factor EnvC (AmiA/AmiB activator)
MPYVYEEDSISDVATENSGNVVIQSRVLAAIVIGSVLAGIAVTFLLLPLLPFELKSDAALMAKDLSAVKDREATDMVQVGLQLAQANTAVQAQQARMDAVNEKLATLAQNIAVISAEHAEIINEQQETLRRLDTSKERRNADPPKQQ